MPPFVRAIDTLGSTRVGGSGRQPSGSWFSFGVGGWLVVSSGSYSNTSGILPSVGANGERGLSNASSLDTDMSVVEVTDRGSGCFRRVAGAGCAVMLSWSERSAAREEAGRAIQGGSEKRGMVVCLPAADIPYGKSHRGGENTIMVVQHVLPGLHERAGGLIRKETGRAKGKRS
jgi:hypothetical protein